MITTHQIQALIATDREALVALLMLAMARGQHRYGADEWQYDAEILTLLSEAERRLRSPVLTVVDRDRWNEMSEVTS